MAEAGADGRTGTAFGNADGQHFRKGFVAGAALFKGSSADFVASAVLSQGGVQIPWQARHFRKVRCVAGAALSIDRQADGKREEEREGEREREIERKKDRQSEIR